MVLLLWYESHLLHHNAKEDLLPFSTFLTLWGNIDEKITKLFHTLKEINSKLWVIEDEKRLCEKNWDFGENFVQLSRNVHLLNDKRANIKLEINNITGSKIKEVKDYTNY